MTESETIKVLADLHTLHLANEPTNVNDLVYIWLAFFHDDDARIINKACYIYTKIRKNRFWPTPGDIEALKTRAAWLVEMDKQEAEALVDATYHPKAPAISIAEQAQSFCELCGLCDEQDQSKCPMDF